MPTKAGITIAIKGEINDLEAKISQSKEIINEATKQLIAENSKLKISQDAITNAQKTYSAEINKASNEIKKYLAIKSENGKLTKEEQQNLSAAKAELALYKTKTKELVDVEKLRQQEITKTKNALKELQNIQRASINDARLEIDTKKKIIALEKETANSKDKTEQSTSNLANTTIRYLRWAGTIAGVVYAGKRAWDATIGSGIAVNKIIENNTYGIAALVSANTQMVDSIGNTLTPIQKFVLGQEHAKKIIAELRTESVKTAATFPQLLEIFQQGIGKTLSMGDAFGATTEEIEKNTIKLASRMSNFANAIGMPMDRVREEMRSLVSANASTDSLIATIIFGSPGEANTAVREAQKKVNGVAELLDKKFAPFDILAETKTFDKSVLAIQDAWSRAMGDMVEKSGAFKDITNLFYGMSQNIISGTDDIVASFDSMYEATKTIAGAIENIALVGAILYVGGKLDTGLVAASRAFAGLGTAVTSVEGIVLSLTLGVAALQKALVGLIAVNPFTALAVAGTAAFPIFSAINDEIIKMQHNGKTQEEFNAIIKQQNDEYISLEATHKRLQKGLEETTKKQEGLLKAQQIYNEKGLDSSKITEQLKKINQEIEGYQAGLESTGELIGTKESVATAKKVGELIVQIGVDTDRIKKDEKEILKTKGNIAEWESEIAEYRKTQADSTDKLKKAEAQQAQIKKQSGQEDKATAITIATLKKDIANQDLLIQLKQAKIAEENQKNTEKSTRETESKLRKQVELNKQSAEEAGIRAEIEMYLSGNIDIEKLAVEQQRIKIAGLNEEYARLTNKAAQEKVLLEILKEQYSYNDKLQKLEDKKQSQYKFDKISGIVKYGDMQNLGEIYQELLVYYKEDPESLADLEKWVEREQNKLSKKPLVLDIKLQGWDDISNSVATFSNSFQDINKAQKKYQQENEKVIKDENTLNQARIDLRDTTMSGIADMTGAIGNFYDEDDDRRKKQLELQKVFYAAKMAMQVAELAQSTAFTSVFLAQETAKGATAATTAVAVAAQSSPWTGFATAAAMLALMASLGIMIGGKTKTSTVSDYYSSMTANEGKGTVLGDTEAQSQSITKALETLKDFAKPEYQLMQSMNKHLEAIANNIGGVTSLLIQQGGFAFGEGYSGFDTGFKNTISLNDITLGLMNPISNLISKIPILGQINSLFGGIVNSVLGGVFGKTKTYQDLTDSGIYFANQLLTNAINDFNGAAYQTITTTVTKKSWFSKSTTTYIDTYFQALDNETERQFSLVLSNLYNTVIEAGTALDSSAEQTAKSLKNFIVSIGKISLQGKTGDQIQETLESIFGSIGDKIATVAFPALIPFQQVGEGMYSTLIRVATGMEEAEYYINRLGKAFSDISYTDIINTQGDVGFEALLQSIVKTDEATYGLNNNLVQIITSLDSTAEELYGAYTALDNLRETLKFLKLDTDAVSFATIRGAGSLDALSSGVSAYIENFLTDEEQLAYSTTLLQKEFEKLNIQMPTSKQGFKDLLSSLDLSTESGQELYGRLIILSESFAEVADESEKLYDETISRITNIQNSFLDLIGLIDTTINNLLGKQTGNTTTEATITSYLTKREQVDTLLEKGSSLTETELSTLNSLVSELASMATTIQSGFEDNTVITGNLVQDLALVKSKLNYTNQFVQTDLAVAQGNILTTGFDMGGYTGEGQKFDIKGFVHAKEYVVNSEEVNAIGGPEAVKNMVQRQIIQKNTSTTNTSTTYSNNKSDIIAELKQGQETIINGFNAMLSRLEDIIDYNDERREQNHSVTVTGTVVIGG